jgi:hypothetical protein
LRFSETGSIEVTVLLILADKVFLFLSAIIRAFPNSATQKDSLPNIAESFGSAKHEFSDYLSHAVLTGCRLSRICTGGIVL